MKQKRYRINANGKVNKLFTNDGILFDSDKPVRFIFELSNIDTAFDKADLEFYHLDTGTIYKIEGNANNPLEFTFTDGIEKGDYIAQVKLIKDNTLVFTSDMVTFDVKGSLTNVGQLLEYQNSSVTVESIQEAILNSGISEERVLELIQEATKDLAQPQEDSEWIDVPDIPNINNDFNYMAAVVEAPNIIGLEYPVILTEIEYSKWVEYLNSDLELGKDYRFKWAGLVFDTIKTYTYRNRYNNSLVASNYSEDREANKLRALRLGRITSPSTTHKLDEFRYATPAIPTLQVHRSYYESPF